MTSKCEVGDRECPVKKYNETKLVSGIYRIYAIDPKMVLAIVTVNYRALIRGQNRRPHDPRFSGGLSEN